MTHQPFAVSKATAAEILSVSQHTVSRWIKAGLLRASKPSGGRVMIRMSDIEKMLDGTTV